MTSPFSMMLFASSSVARSRIRLACVLSSSYFFFCHEILPILSPAWVVLFSEMIFFIASFFSSSVSILSPARQTPRSEEHTSELQSQSNLVCRLLLEKTTALLSLQRPSLREYPAETIRKLPTSYTNVPAPTSSPGSSTPCPPIA